jgi:RsiW-degrading membrane proteinase PrsW (M82 family)
VVQYRAADLYLTTFIPAVIFVVALASLIPAILYLIIIRNSERYGKEKWRSVLGAFFWGIIAAIIAAFLELFTGFFIPSALSFTALVVAPLVEEITKPLIFFGTRDKEVEDTIIKCASAGIGFASLENFLYFLGAETSLLPLIVFIRTIDGFMMHAAASGLVGIGIAKGRTIPYLILAMLVHSFSNFLVSSGALGIVAAIIFAMLIFGMMGALIMRYDSKNDK